MKYPNISDISADLSYHYFLRGKYTLKRKKMMHQAHLKYGYTLKEIANYLGIHYTTVSKALSALET